MADGSEGTRGVGAVFAGWGTGPGGAGSQVNLEAGRGRATDLLAITAVVMGTVALIVTVIQVVADPGWWPSTIPFVVMYALVLGLMLSRGRIDYRIRAWGLLLVGYAAASTYLAVLGLMGNGVVFLAALPVVALVVLGTRPGVALAGLSVVIYVAFAAAAASGVMAGWLAVTENSLAASQWLSQGLSFGLILAALVVVVAWLGRTQERALTRLQASFAELSAVQDELASNSSALDEYAQALETVVGVSREASGVLDRDELLRRVVVLLATRLGLHGVAVYLWEQRSDTLVAGPAAGPWAGEGAAARPVPEMVAELARAARQRPEGPLPEGTLPEGTWPESTRGESTQDQPAGVPGLAELALPLRAGERLLGVLYLASPAKMADRVVQALHLMADQLAVALDNARLFAEAQVRVDELNKQQLKQTDEAWASFVAERSGTHYSWQPAGRPGEAVWQETLSQARVQGPSTGYDEATGQHVLAVPVRLRESVIGVLGFYRPRDAGAWQPEEVAAIEAVSARLAFATENLRLLEQTQRRAAHDRVVDDIARQVQASLDPETILKVAVREVGRALGASQSLVELGAPGEQPWNPPGEPGDNGGMGEGR